MACPASDHERLVLGGHYYDCGDGTVLDLSTGLMWETSTGQSDGLGCDVRRIHVAWPASLAGLRLPVAQPTMEAFSPPFSRD